MTNFKNPPPPFRVDVINYGPLKELRQIKKIHQTQSRTLLTNSQTLTSSSDTNKAYDNFIEIFSSL